MMSYMVGGVREACALPEKRRHARHLLSWVVLNLNWVRAVGYTDPSGIHDTDLRLPKLLIDDLRISPS